VIELPTEILDQISEKLSFFDRKFLQIVSKQIYFLTGPLKCPDPLSWIMHICWTAYNTGIYDYTALDPEQIIDTLNGINIELGKSEIGCIDNLKAQAVSMRYCSKDIWHLYFTEEQRSGLHEGTGDRLLTLGTFMLYHVREYAWKAYLHKGRQMKSFGIAENGAKDCTEFEAWGQVQYPCHVVAAVLSKKWWR